MCQPCASVAVTLSRPECRSREKGRVRAVFAAECAAGTSKVLPFLGCHRVRALHRALRRDRVSQEKASAASVMCLGTAVHANSIAEERTRVKVRRTFRSSLLAEVHPNSPPPLHSAHSIHFILCINLGLLNIIEPQRSLGSDPLRIVGSRHTEQIAVGGVLRIDAETAA